MATTDQRLAALEAVVFPAPADEPVAEVATATVTDDDKVITSTTDDEATLRAEIAAKSSAKK